MGKDGILQTYEKRAQKIKKMKKNRVFLKYHRRRLLSNAQGKVLEVAVGSGSNLEFYPDEVEITAVDFSPTLLEIAKETAKKQSKQVEFIVADVEQLQIVENSYDTIVSTLSLCAYDNPIKVLNNFNKFCKPGGDILLLEHGIMPDKHFGKLGNKFLHRIDSWSVKQVGCHSNRDILKLINDSDIEVKQVETFLLGTHYLIWAKPSK